MLSAAIQGDVQEVAAPSPVLYAVGMAENGSPCVSRLGVATETTGVVRE